MHDRYGPDVLTTGRRRGPTRVPEVPGDLGLVVECADSGWCGAVVGWDRASQGWAVVLEDRHGRRRLFPASAAAFLLEGDPVTLTRPSGLGMPQAPAQPTRTASGSLARPAGPARVARDSRIWVEGRHDAELLERVWGSDLRELAVVVEPLGGIDDLMAAISDFGPRPGRLLCVLVDHLVPGSKETRIANEVHRRWRQHVRVLGHPFVDVWQAVRPVALGIPAWPTVPPGTAWKAGVCKALGWPADEAAAWRRILAAVHCYADLEPELLARVEEALDLVGAGSG